MARPTRTTPIAFHERHKLTANLLERASCTPGRPFVLLRDADEAGLRLRITAAGGRHWQYETRLPGGKLFTRSLGSWPEIDVRSAQAEARRLRSLREGGQDPREVEREEADRARQARELADRQQQEELRRLEALEKAHVQREAAEATREHRERLTVRDAWDVYVEARKPVWGERNYRDHLKLAAAGGEHRKRLRGVMTKPGALASLMPTRLIDLTSEVIEQWAKEEAEQRSGQLRLALRLLRAFLNWAARQREYSGLVTANAVKSPEVREAAGRPRRKVDVLERSQLNVWFREVRALPNPVVSAYLQTLLLTGARPGEAQTLRWENVDFQWHRIVIRDKVDGDRSIPLTPYVAELLRALPRRNAWVFSSTREVSQEDVNVARRTRYHQRAGTQAPTLGIVAASAQGYIADPGTPHREACERAGLAGLTLHGLRRSFSSLTEWLEIPAGVVAQIQGHKPSATAEKHYKIRPIDLLRVHHERIERWVLKEAGIEFESTGAEPSLRLAAVA